MKKALVLSLAVVLGLGVASFGQGVLSGYWNSEITIVPTPIAITAFDSEIFVQYAISGWEFSSLTVLALDGWADQEFGFSGALGAFTLGGTLSFTPIPGAFDYLLVNGGVSLAGVEFGITWLLEGLDDVGGGDTGDIGVELTASGTAGAVTVDVAVGFGDIGVLPLKVGALGHNTLGMGNDVCDLDWNSVAIDVTFPFCCAEITGSLAFDCEGFVSACFEVDNILIPNLPWLDIDAKVCFDRDGDAPDYTYDKSFYLKPGFTLGTIACFNLYAYLDLATWGAADEPITLSSITFKGFGLSCDIAGVTFTGLTWLDGTTANASKPGILKYTKYYEAYQIATTDDGCCGPFDFDLTFYFLKEAASLFDIAEVVANVSYELGANFTFTTGLTVDMVLGFSEWTIGFEVTW
jgi:hypothetical protein